MTATHTQAGLTPVEMPGKQPPFVRSLLFETGDEKNPSALNVRHYHNCYFCGALIVAGIRGVLMPCLFVHMRHLLYSQGKLTV